MSVISMGEHSMGWDGIVLDTNGGGGQCYMARGSDVGCGGNAGRFHSKNPHVSSFRFSNTWFFSGSGANVDWL